jgi:hypothetical protein
MTSLLGSRGINADNKIKIRVKSVYFPQTTIQLTVFSINFQFGQYPSKLFKKKKNAIVPPNDENTLNKIKLIFFKKRKLKLKNKNKNT